MAWNGELVGERGFFGEDQEQILNEYFNGCGRVVVSAGAGTGKTTLLVKIVAKAVVRLLKADPNQNPFQKILAVTFTVEATRQMKTKIKKQLEQHFKAIGQPEKIRDLVRWIESESWILTLDSLTRTLLSEVAYDLGLSSIATVPDEYELGKIREEIIQEIKSNDDLVNEVQLVESVFPDEEWRGERGWVGVLEELFQKARMYCLSAKELGERAFHTFEKRVYQGLKPPFDEEKIREICKVVYNEKLKNKKNSAKITPKMVDESYEFNRKILEAFINLLEEYERLYDEKTKPKGMLGHDDARYWIVRYASGKIKNANHIDAWLQTQRNRFKHILVDEFQDTSYAQCELLKHFIGEDTKVFLIGDPKQAIYQWRTAEPEIFIKILDKIREEGESGKLPFLEV
ncbi:MAG: UvrD-helicase domain-containing protein, partial [Candidatus Freyarchaeota archaeon]